MQNATKNARLVRNFFDALNSMDLENLRPMLWAKTIWRPMVRNMTEKASYQGDAIIDDFLAPVRGIFKGGGPVVKLTKLVADDSGVAAETDGNGETLDGKIYDNRYAWFFDIEDGKIIEIREYFDSNYVAKLIGD